MNKCNIKEPDCYKAVCFFDFSVTVDHVALRCWVNAFMHFLGGRGGGGRGGGRLVQGNANVVLRLKLLLVR